MSALLALFLIGCDTKEDTSPPVLALQPWSLEFGQVTTGLPASQTFEVLNTGGSELIVDELSVLDVTGDAPFSLEPTSLAIAPGERETVTVTFAPPGEGEARWDVIFSSNTEAPVTLPLQGWGVTPRVEVSPRAYSCPLDGEAHTDFLTVTNHGPGELAFSLAVDDAGGAFWIDEPLDDALLPGGEDRVVRFGCQSAAYAEGALVVTTNDPDAASVSVPLYAETLRLEGEITSHADGDVVDEGEITMSARVWGTDHHEPDYPFERMSYTWHSVISGRLGAGFLSEDGVATLEGVLEPGRDTLTFVAISQGESAEEIIVLLDLSVDDAPIITDLTPSGGWLPGGELPLRATVSDASDAMGDLEVDWSSDLSGDLGAATPDASGVASLTVTLSPGAHTLTATVTNPRDLSSSADITIDVLDCGDTSDADGDGYTVAGGDCDDSDPGVFPGADGILGEDSACTGASITTITSATLETYASLAMDRDLNGDGLADLVIGSPHYSKLPTERQNGAVFLLMGGGPTVSVEAESLPQILNPEEQSTTGFAVTTVPDLNGDGIAELALGAPSEGLGAVYLFEGRASWGTLSTDEADARILGDGSGLVDDLGSALAAGDFDGDGYGDLIIGAPTQDTPVNNGGGVYVFLGAAAHSGDRSQRDADISITGEEPSAYLGYALAAGDFDGDGRDEVAIGAPLTDRDNVRDVGAVYLFAGLSGSDGALTSGDADAALFGDSSDAEIGSADSLHNAGDVTGDGLDDLLVRSFLVNSSGPPSTIFYGELHLMPGAEDFLDSTLADAWSWKDTQSSSRAGGLSGAGDLDGDGYADILVGLDTPSDWERAVGVISGADAEGSVNADYTGGAARFLSAVSGDTAGTTVSGGGDLNGDGRPDFAVHTTDGDVGSVLVYESGATCLSP